MDSETMRKLYSLVNHLEKKMNETNHALTNLQDFIADIGDDVVDEEDEQENRTDTT